MKRPYNLFLVTSILTITLSEHDSYFNPQTPVAQKSADEVVFRHFQGEGLEFF